MKSKKKFNFYGNCIIIHGFSNSLLYDLDRGYYIIPASQQKLLKKKILAFSVIHENHESEEGLTTRMVGKFSGVGLGIY